MADRTRLVLIRHGESRCMVEGVAGGHKGCTGLTDRGREQASRLHDRLAATNELGSVDVVVTSTLPRAIETAAIISPALGGLVAEQHCDWCEHHIGEADGLAESEVVARYGRPRWDDPDWRMAPGGETAIEFRARVAETIRRTAEAHVGRSIVAVCHGGVVNSAFRALVGSPPPAWIPVANTSLTVWSKYEDGRWELERLNDAAHLLPAARWESPV